MNGDNIDGPVPPENYLEGLKFNIELQYGPIRPALYHQVVQELRQQIDEAMRRVLSEGRLTFAVDGHNVEPQMGVTPVN
jgi:hypothetical protein